MTPNETILEPLGGEDNLRMMCDADNFIYRIREVEFSIKNRRVKIYRTLYSDGTPRWGVNVFDDSGLHRSYSQGVIAGESLERVFTIATGYTLRF